MAYITFHLCSKKSNGKIYFIPLISILFIIINYINSKITRNNPHQLILFKKYKFLSSYIFNFLKSISKCLMFLFYYLDLMKKKKKKNKFNNLMILLISGKKDITINYKIIIIILFVSFLDIYFYIYYINCIIPLKYQIRIPEYYVIYVFFLNKIFYKNKYHRNHIIPIITIILLLIIKFFCYLIIEKNDKNNIYKLFGYTLINNFFISFNLQMFQYLMNICYIDPNLIYGINGIGCLVLYIIYFLCICPFKILSFFYNKICLFYIINIGLFTLIYFLEIRLLLNFNIIFYSFVHLIFSLFDFVINNRRDFQAFFFILDFIIILIYTENIQIHICGFDKYYDENIIKREREETKIILEK